MMKFSTLFVLASLFVFSTNAQSLGPSLVASSGDYFENQTVHLEWSLGEVTLASHTNSGTTLTQGLHQAEIDVVTGFEDQLIAITIYPNPASESVRLRTDYSIYPELRTTIHDVSGKIMLESVINGNRNLLDISNLGEGVYYIKIYGNGNLIKSSKLIKS